MNVQKDDKRPSEIEIGKALKQVKAIADEEQYDQVLQILAGDRNERIARAVTGLTEEDEFLLLCMLMRTATHLAPLEQKSSIAVGNAAPDLLARFQPGHSGKGIPSSKHSGYRCFVEVKSTKKHNLRIASSTLQKIRDFADAFGLPLVFAVRFLTLHGIALWVIVEDRDRSKKSLTITMSDWIQGLRPVLWNEYSYMLFPRTYFEATYSPDITGDNVRHSEYGEQIAFHVITTKGRVALSGKDAILASAFFEAYGLEEAASKREDNLVHVTYQARNLMMSIADLIYGMNRLPRDENGRMVYDASKALRELADGHTATLVGRDLVEHLGGKFCDIGALGIVEFGEPEERYQRWLATGGDE